ncbi:unnamed protein product [Caenorhabditis bovis]|uniref:Tetratricopeptide repeat protein 8 n=1 Tax=Caenorhabditis bovis TaxID=2654633 RepID=A0A8S1EIJ7_9PELO|nr:unnamed protein product [Caenorhabditis bovis]
MSAEKNIRFEGFVKAYRLFRNNKLAEAEAVCTELLRKNPLDQATWALKLQCLSDATYVDELENEDVGLAEAFLDQNVIATNTRPGTSFQRPTTTAKGMNPIMRPTTNAGRPLSGIVRPQTMRQGTMEQAIRTARTAKTARAVSSTSARNMRLGTASMAAGADGEFVNLARLNIEKYASDKQVNRQLFEYVFYFVGDIKVAHQIAGCATRAAEYEDYYWKNQLAKCYYRLGMLPDAEKQLLSSAKQMYVVETFAFLGKVYNRMDQPVAALKSYSEGLSQFEHDVTLLTGMARVKELLGEYDDSINIYKKVLEVQANNIEAIACVATTHYYSGKPEIALRYYRRILQMGVSSAELFMNIGLCCLAAQQFDFALSSIMRAQATMTEDVGADIWYNIGHVMVEVGDLRYAARAYRIALSMDPDHCESLVNLGILKHQDGKIDEARSLYQAAVSKNPQMFEANFNLGMVSYQQGKYDDCRRLITKALEVFPEHEHCLKILKMIKSIQLTLIPHFAMDSVQNSLEWNLSCTKTYVQWIVHHNDSFEQTIFEFKISRQQNSFTRMPIVCIFLANLIQIFAKFPVFKMESNDLMCFFPIIQLIIGLISSFSTPHSIYLTTFESRLLAFIILSVIIELSQQLLPFFVFYLRCCPMESDPNPPKYPSPGVQFSLDTERSKCHAALDSARIDSVRSPRIANFDMCMAELKFTMSLLEETINQHSSAEWRQRLWRNSYHRIQTAMLLIFNILNISMLLTFLK